jgi:hypothetical protein
MTSTGAFARLGVEHTACYLIHPDGHIGTALLAPTCVGF